MKINAGQASSTLIPEYIGSDFDKVITVADNINDVKTVSVNINDVVAVGDNIQDVSTVANDVSDVALVANNIDYVKDVADGIEGLPVTGYIGDTPPTQPKEGATWYCTLDGRNYTWYEDIDSGQWVESSPQSTTDDPHLAGNIFTLWKRSAAESGYSLVAGSFEEGGVLTSPTDVLWHKGLDSIYSWTGAFPKVVAPGTDPAANAGFVMRSDAGLRSELAAVDGAKLAFSQVATAYGIDYANIKSFNPSESYNTSDYVFYDNCVWRPYADNTVQSSVTYNYFYKVPKRGERWSPELFGCSGLGESSPDTVYFAKMLATVPARSTIWLTPGAEYYNSAPSGISDMWVVNKELKFVGFGSKISRRPSNAGENNFSTLKIASTASFTKLIGDIEISGNEPEFNLVNSSGADISTITYARALSSSHCIHIEAAKDVTLDGIYLHHSNFCLWAYGADRLVAKIRVHKSGQTYPVVGADLQLGAGIKLTSCNDFEVDVTARYCTNAGLEIEPDNYNGIVKVVGNYNYQSDLTITQSQDIIYDVTGRNTRYGVQLSTGAKNITGRSNHTLCSVSAVNVQPISANEIANIDLEINAHDCAGYGLYHFAQAANINNYRYRVNIINCKTANEGAIVRGPGLGFLSGNIKGSSVGVSPNGTSALFMHDLDLTGNTTSYYAVNNAVFGMDAVRTDQGLLNMLPSSDARVYNVKQSTTAGVYQFTAITDYVVRATNLNVPNMPTAGTQSGQLYYDPADGNRVKFKV